MHKDADRVGADFRFDLREEYRSPLNSVADHAGAGRDVAFFDGAAACGIGRVESVIGFDMEAG